MGAGRLGIGIGCMGMGCMGMGCMGIIGRSLPLVMGIMGIIGIMGMSLPLDEEDDQELWELKELKELGDPPLGKPGNPLLPKGAGIGGNMGMAFSGDCIISDGVINDLVDMRLLLDWLLKERWLSRCICVKPEPPTWLSGDQRE
jgi:hypothetical protein